MPKSMIDVIVQHMDELPGTVRLASGNVSALILE
jgi:hypothetical protein